MCGYNRSSVGTVSCSATGTVRGIDKVGGLVGMNGSGKFTSCYAQGRVAGTSSVGGFAGYNSGRVRDCYSASNVTGQTRLGGLVGSNWEDIGRCTCSGEVLGDDTIGGLVGYNYDTIASCYTTASVTGHSAVGGLIGHNCAGTVEYSYAASVVAGDGNNVGGFVGRDYERGKFLLCYWDTDVSGLTSSQGGFGRRTARMQQAHTFRGWQASDWTIQDGVDYPRLAWEQKAGEPIGTDALPYGGGTGEPNDPYQVWTPEQFVEIAHRPADFAKCFALMADIDMAQIDSDEMIPIGSGATPFLGRFDGNGHTLSNFRSMYPGSPCMGVFGVIGWTGYSWQTPPNVIGIIAGLHVVGANLSGGSCTGGLAGMALGQIVDCSVAGHVEGADYTGGLVGSISGEIRGASYEGTVRGDRCVGGLAGYCKGTVGNSSSSGVASGHQQVGGLVGYHSGVLDSCASACAVDASGPFVGGLAGDCGGPVTSCHATGNVSGYRYVGGLIGSNSGNLQGCYATGQVVADSNEAGGLVGSSWGNNPTAIAACWATGPVRGLDRVGGLVGSCRASILECYSRSDVIGRDRVGGLLGTVTEPVTSSYAQGSVTGRDYIGGLIGYDWSPVVTCYATGRVSGAGRSGNLFVQGLLGFPLSKEIESCFWNVETSGVAGDTRWDQSGVTGKTTTEMQTATTFIDAGWDFESVWMICEGRDYPRLQWENVDCSAEPMIGNE